jgi:hypothetical protein
MTMRLWRMWKAHITANHMGAAAGELALMRPEATSAKKGRSLEKGGRMVAERRYISLGA